MARRLRDGVRSAPQSRNSDSLPKRLTADLYYRAHNWMSHDKIPENAGDFRLLDRKVVDAIRALPERNRFMKGLFAWAGFRQTAVEYDRAERNVGGDQIQLLETLDLRDGRNHSASTAPLRIWSYVGAVVAFLRCAMPCSSLPAPLIFGMDMPGYASIMVSVLFLGGVQLLSLGILGEYVGPYPDRNKAASAIRRSRYDRIRLEVISLRRPAVPFLVMPASASALVALTTRLDARAGHRSYRGVRLEPMLRTLCRAPAGTMTPKSSPTLFSTPSMSTATPEPSSSGRTGRDLRGPLPDFLSRLEGHQHQLRL